MRALVQRVSRASVSVDGRLVSEIGPGLLVLLGVTHEDTDRDADWLADKVRALRIFPDADGRMNEPLGDREVLCVSQFTLYGDARRGNRPSYVAAAPPEHAEPLYERFCERLGAKRGVFGAMMAVELVNDGPVTLMVESPGLQKSSSRASRWRGLTAAKCRRSSVITIPAPIRSASAITLASVPPSGKSAYLSTSSAIRSKSSAVGPSTSKAPRPRRKAASARAPRRPPMK